MKTIDFFIVGEPKSGTTALANFLSQHDQVFISQPKEPAYFATDKVKESIDYNNGKNLYFRYANFKKYLALFKNADEKQILGEASTIYLYSNDAAKNIYEHNKDAKIIIMLRKPVEFLPSLHMQYLNEGIENIENFEDALLLEKQRIKGKELPKKTMAPSYLFYLDRTKYYDHIQRYFKYFNKSNILVILNEDFKKDNKKVFDQACRFLNISQQDIDFKTVHGSVKPKIRIVHKLLNNQLIKNIFHTLMGPEKYDRFQKKVKKIIMKKQIRPELSSATTDYIQKNTFKQVKKLSKLLEIDLLEKWGYK